MSDRRFVSPSCRPARHPSISRHVRRGVRGACRAGAGEESADGRRLHEVEEHQRPELSGDGKWVTLRDGAHEHRDGRVEAGAAPVNLETNQTWKSRMRRGGAFLGRLEVDRLHGGSSRGRPWWTRRSRGRGRRRSARRRSRRRPRHHQRHRRRPDPPARPRQARTPRRPPQGRGATANAPAPPRRVELRNLATGAIKSWQDIQSFTFSPNSTHLMLRRRAPQARRRRGGPRRW